MKTEQLAWFVARASGITSWALATASIVFGLSLSTRLVRKKGVPAWLNALHRYLGTLMLVFTAVHIGALVADNWVHFGVADLFVPMASSWRPGAVAWGIVSLYLLLAVQITSWAKKWLPKKLWHWVHLTSIPMFVFGTVHGFQSGADRNNVVVQWGALTGSVSILFLMLFRTTSRLGRGRLRSGASGAVTGGAEDRIARLHARRGSADGGNPLGDERLQGRVQPTVRERGVERGEREDPVGLLPLGHHTKFLPGGLGDAGTGLEPVDVGLEIGVGTVEGLEGRTAGLERVALVHPCLDGQDQ